MPRRVVLCMVSFVLVVSGLPATAAPGSNISAPPDPPAPQAALVDRDGDNISDDLQAKLAEAHPADRFDITASFSAPGQAVAATSELGLRRPVDLLIIHGFVASATAAQIKGLARARGVERIDEDFAVSITNNTANVDFGTAAGRVDYELTGAGVGICIVDTGVDPGHEQTDNVVGWYDAVNGRSDPYDDQGHGTHVAGTAAGDGEGLSAQASTYMGVAPGALLYAAKVLDSNGTGTESQVIAGIDWCARQAGVRIISMSLGTAASSDGNDNLSKAVNNAVTGHGKVAVVAAGNSGDTPSTVGSPGAAAQAITVGAVAEWSGSPSSPGHSMGIYLTPWSSRGPTADGRTKPDVVAPGHTITSAAANTGTGYVTSSGTSMATPFVSGTVALALEAEPTLNPSQVREALEGTAHDRGPSGKDNDWGSGLVDGYAFLSQVAGGTGQTAFPEYARTSGAVPNNGVWSWSFEVTDTAVPVAAMVTINGQAVCVFWFFTCLIWEWDPDLEARLLDPSGTVVATSECPAFGDCAGAGRQETLHIFPGTTGTYTLEVYPYSGSPNNGKGGSFWVDLSTGPVAHTGPSDAPPSVSITGPADGSTVSGTLAITATAADDDGVTQVEFSYQGNGGTVVIDTDSNGTDGWSASWDTTSVEDGPYTLIATATDTGGQTAQDAVSVTVGNTDLPPSVSLTSPEDGAVVSGDVAVSADATDAQGVAQVEFFVDGVSIGVDSDGTNGWSVAWDTTTGADGSREVAAVATDTIGQTTTETVSVTVDNTEPSVSIISPEEGAVVSGTVTVSAAATDATPGSGVTKVEFFIDDVSIGTDSDGTDGWSVVWDTTTTGNVTHHLVAVATDGAGNEGTSAPVSVMVENQHEATFLHIDDLDATSQNDGRTWTARVTITVLDSTGAPAIGATVSGTWSDGGTGTASCTTGVNGTCTVSLEGMVKKAKSVTFTVDDVTHALRYEPTANTDRDGDSDGTSIVVAKP